MRSPYLDAPPAIRAAVAFTSTSLLMVGLALIQGNPVNASLLGAPVALAAFAWWQTKKPA